MEIGQVYECNIEDMTTEAKGIGKVNGMAVFISGAVIGDIVSLEITKVKKNYGFGRLLHIIKPSKWRVEAACDYSKTCGGCGLQELGYEAQLTWKQNVVTDRLKRLAAIEDPLVRPIIGMEQPYRYRNKAQMPISCGGIITKKGGDIENVGTCEVGFYQAKSHQVVDCEICLIQAEPAERLAAALRKYMQEDHITAWDPKWEKGLMRHLIVKTAFGTGEVMAILVVNGKGLPNGEKLIGLMDDEINRIPPREDGVVYSLESVILNVNKKKTAQIMGEKSITLAGKPTILEQVGELQFEISPRSFYQVNPKQMVKLYDKVLEYADLTGEELVLDLYCGVGTIGLYCAKHAAKVIGIESVKEAVLDANRNAVINGIVNAEFICGRAEEELVKLRGMKPDVVILDPPRTGCKRELLGEVAKAAPKKIVYVSCDPATMARDVKVLGLNGYEFVEAQPVDMFGGTTHVECVCLMTRNK